MNRARNRNPGGNCNPRGRSSRAGSNSAHRKAPVIADGSSDDVPLGQEENLSPVGRQTSGKLPMGSISKPFDRTFMSYQQDFPLPGAKDLASEIENFKLVHNSPEVAGHSSKQLDCLSTSDSKSEEDFPSLSAQSDPRVKHLNKESSLLVETCIKDGPCEKESERGQTSHEKTGSAGISENSGRLPPGAPFDICRERSQSIVRLNAPLHVKNREKRNAIKRSMEGQHPIILRSGMVLLKSHISCRDQVKLVKTCQELGLGSGGFYQPGYRDGAKLNLKMMCLGKNWDPETSEYGDLRPLDGAKPPFIPEEFHQLVKRSLQDSHAYLQTQPKTRNVEDMLPLMSPNICIVNFYASSGRLGLHQDKDETQESLHRGLPVVSFSVGDSAEFLYGDQRDIEKAEKVILESGDVLIFGGKSRHIFHGVTAIIPDTAPKALLEESNLRPGRLNLTFREY